MGRATRPLQMQRLAAGEGERGRGGLPISRLRDEHLDPPEVEVPIQDLVDPRAAALLGLPPPLARLTITPMRRERRDGTGARRSAFAVTCTAAALAALAPSCSSPSTDRDVSALDATIDVAPPPPRTLTFVLDQLTIDENDDPSVPHTGFNLDGLFSTDAGPLGCAHADYLSLHDDDQNCSAVMDEHCVATPNVGCTSTERGCVGGVDNQLPTLAIIIQTAASADIRSTLQESVSTNKLSVVVRITGIDDWTTDPVVRVAMYRAYPTFGTDCTAVLPGREYAVDRTYVGGRATDIDSPLFAYDGSIAGGRLRFAASPRETAGFNLPISMRGLTLNLRLHGLQIRANVAADALSIGSLGGWIGGDEFLTDLAVNDPYYITVRRGIIGALCDVEVNRVCDGSALNPPRFGGISIGLGIHGVPATIASGPAAIVSGPAVGTCGYTPPLGSDR